MARDENNLSRPKKESKEEEEEEEEESIQRSLRSNEEAREIRVAV